MVDGNKQHNSATTTQRSTQSGRPSSTTDLDTDRALAGTKVAGSPANAAVASGATSAQLTAQRQQIKSRRREFKAVYLTGAVVGTFVVLWIPHEIGRILESAGYHSQAVGYVGLVGGAIGSANFAFAWLIYAAVSRKYRRAYRQMLIRIGCCMCKNVTLPADNSLVD